MNYDIISETYNKVIEIDDNVNNKFYNFISKAKELIELSEDDYQIEKTLTLNKISLKDYILNSPCCKALKENNIENYSIDELKNYLIQYKEDQKYNLAISLYELIEEIEKIIDDKINMEIDELKNVVSNIEEIKNIDSKKYESLYINIKTKLSNNYNSKLIDEKSLNIYIQLLNDIFNFYISGYPNIPEDYLYPTDDY